MKSPDFDDLEQLFHAAVDLPTADRADFLRRVDPERAKAVLLMIEGAMDPDWNSSALEIEARQTALDFRPARPGETFGPYRIVRRIATGGMSIVYEAIRDDAEFQKRVAIKFVQGIQDASSFERFRVERQILAQLEHPNIARLLDGGTTDDRVPYLVMEYVAGLPIDRFAAELHLSRAQRLKLFLQVCDAVQYAHQSLVVHRDLKPANILVSTEGVPKLLDFGIAKLLTGAPAGQTLAALTPEYSSPEQLLGRSAGIPSDIYSLGVLLFGLLAERLPYGEAASASELVAGICEKDPVWHPPGLIDRDLESILGKALRKEPERRYGSVEQFSADIHAYLEGRPVLARSGELLYRAGKFVKRHAMAVAATAAVLIAIAAGVASTVTQSRRVERRFNELRTLAHSDLFDVYDSIKSLPGSLPARRLMATNAQHYLDSLAGDAADDPDLVRDLAESYLRLGDVRGGPFGMNLGDTAGALESYSKAQALIEAEALRHPKDAGIQLELAQAYLSLGRVLARQDRLNDAIAIEKRSIQTMEELTRQFPGNADYAEKFARAYQYLAESLSMAGQRDRSVEGLQAALNAAVKAVNILESAGTLASEEWQTSLSSKYFSVGYRLTSLSKITGDRSYDRKALDAELKGHAINRALAAAHPGKPSRQLADGLLSTALSRWRCCGDFDQAVSDLHESLDHFERLAAADPQNIEARRDLANAYYTLGLVISEAGRKTEALHAVKKALAILEELKQIDPTNGEDSGQRQVLRAELDALSDSHSTQGLKH